MIPDPDIVTAIIRNVAEEIVLPRFRRLGAHEISKKSAGEIVTVADEESELALARELTALLPSASVVGEEGVSRDPRAMDALSGDGPVWIVDPVDGTQNFADGKPCFALIVALVRGGCTVAGWIHEPVADTTVWARAGEGAFEAGARLHPDAPAAVDELVGSLNKRHRERLEQSGSAGERGLARRARRYRCVGAEYADLARGNLHFARYGGRLKPWDHAAGVLIAQEAGVYGRVMSTETPYLPGPTLAQQTLLLAPDGASWRQLREILED